MDELEAFVVRVDGESDTLGTGFVADSRHVLTCKHVVGSRAAVRIRFASREVRDARVIPELSRPVDREDLAVLELEGGLPDGVEPPRLRPARGASGHTFMAFGYPETEHTDGLLATGTILGTLPSRDGRATRHVQIRSDEITKGHSGAPLFDVATQSVVGMVQAFQKPRYGRNREIGFALSTETILEICPFLELSDRCPYVDLRAFTAEEADLFHGRAALIDRMLDKLRERPQLLAVVGASGTGKSSAIQAGLVPALSAGRVEELGAPEVAVCRPGETLARALAAKRTRAWRVIVCDQLEEMFTGIRGEKQLAQLSRLIAKGQRTTLVLVLRADFYEPLLEAKLDPRLEHAQVNVTALTADEMRQAIVEPARHAGLRFQAKLVDRIVKDLEGTKQPAPLLQFALTELWKRRDGDVLTHTAYEEIGRAPGALARWAGAFYEALGPAEQALARRLLTRLVHCGEGDAPDTRRPVRIADLDPALRPLVPKLAAARLAVTGVESKPTVELVHDGLLREWPALVEWIREHRSFLLWHQSLERAVENWIRVDRHDAALLRGPLLAEALRHREQSETDLTESERTFLDRSSQVEVDADAETRRRQTQMRDARRMAAARQLANDPTRQAAVLREVEDPTSAHGWMECCANALREAVWSYRLPDDTGGWQQLSFDRTGQRMLGVVSYDFGIALFAWDIEKIGWPKLWREDPVRTADGSSVERAWSFVNHETDEWITIDARGSVARWCLESGKDLESEGIESEEEIISWSRFRYGSQRIKRTRTGSPLEAPATGGSMIRLAAYDPARERVAMVRDDGSLRLRDVRSGTGRRQDVVYRKATAPHRQLRFTEIRFAGDLLMGWDDGWFSFDLESPRLDWKWCGKSEEPNVEVSPERDHLVFGRAKRVDFDHEIIRVVRAPGGQIVVALLKDGFVELFSRDGVRLSPAIRRGGAEVQSVAISPDGRRVAIGFAGQPPHVWELPRALDPMTSIPGNMQGLSFDENGALRVVNHLGICSVSERGVVHEIPTPRAVGLVALDEERRYMVDPQLRWRSEIATWVDRGLREPGYVHPPVRSAVDALGDGTRIELGGAPTDQLRALVASPDVRRIAGVQPDGSVLEWDAARPDAPRQLAAAELGVQAVAFSPDGLLLATGSSDGTLRLWSDGNATVLGHADDAINVIEWSPDGRWLFAQVAFEPCLISTADGRRAWKHPRPRWMQFIEGGRALLAVHPHEVARIESSGHETRVAIAGSIDPVILVSPDGRWFLTLSHEDDPRLYSTLSTLQPVVLRGAGSDITLAAASPDGRRVALAHSTGRLTVWSVDLDPTHLTTRLWRHTPYCLTVDERHKLLGEDHDTARANRRAARAKVRNMKNGRPVSGPAV